MAALKPSRPVQTQLSEWTGFADWAVQMQAAEGDLVTQQSLLAQIPEGFVWSADEANQDRAALIDHADLLDALVDTVGGGGNIDLSGKEDVGVAQTLVDILEAALRDGADEAVTLNTLNTTLAALSISDVAGLQAALTANTSAASTAQSTANTALSNAATAQGTANTATNNAATAQADADTGIANAATAQSTADGAVTDAATAQAAANAAQADADTALSNAATAQGTANTATSDAATAQADADTGIANAATAQSTADGAVTDAATAQAAANAAQADADTTVSVVYPAVAATLVEPELGKKKEFKLHTSFLGAPDVNLSTGTYGGVADTVHARYTMAAPTQAGLRIKFSWVSGDHPVRIYVPNLMNGSAGTEQDDDTLTDWFDLPVRGESVEAVSISDGAGGFTLELDDYAGDLIQTIETSQVIDLNNQLAALGASADYIYPHLYATVADMTAGTVLADISSNIASGKLAAGKVIRTLHYYPSTVYATTTQQAGGNTYVVKAGTTGGDKGKLIQATASMQLQGQFSGGVYTNAQFGANGIGTTLADQLIDAAAFQSALTASSGKHLHIPFGTWYYADAAATGSVYNTYNSISGVGFDDTRITCDGTLKLANWDGTTTRTGLGLVGVKGGEWDLIFDGNRANQQDHEHTHTLTIGGCQGWTINNIQCDEIRGDGVYITDLVYNIVSPRTSNWHIKRFTGSNTADDGRNGISIISAIDGQIDYFYSNKIGGTVSAVVQPGGLDFEPSFDHQTVERVNVTYCRAITKGNLGCALIGREGLKSIINCNIHNAYITMRGPSSSAGAMRNSLRSKMKVKIDLDITIYPEPLHFSFNSVYAGRIADCLECDYHVIARGVHRGTIIGTWPGVTGDDPSTRCNITLDGNKYVQYIAQISHLDSCKVKIIGGKTRTAAQLSGGTGLKHGVSIRDNELRGAGGSKVSIKDTELIMDYPYDPEALKAIYADMIGGPGVTLSNVTVSGNMRGWDVEPLNKFDVQVTGVTKTATGLASGATAPVGGRNQIGDVFRRDPIPTGDITAGNYVYEWVRLTTGTGGVVGTDWREHTKA